MCSTIRSVSTQTQGEGTGGDGVQGDGVQGEDTGGDGVQGEDTGGDREVSGKKVGVLGTALESDIFHPGSV